MDLKQLLSRERDLTIGDAARHLDALIVLWNQNASQIKAPEHDQDSLTRFDSVPPDLDKLHHWFNPTATGKRLRESFERLNPAVLSCHGDLGDLVEPIDNERTIVSPEGRVAMWALAVGVRDRVGADGGRDDPLWLSQQQVSAAWATLTVTYRGWNRQRLRDVTGLLREETATLRPSVIGLLLVLLINRNTAKERRLPAPESSKLSSDVSRAVAEPALAFVQALSGARDSRADARGLEVYRGWVIGEIARRLGSGLHREDGIWIDESAVQVAEDRLIAALVNRAPEQLTEVNRALDVLLEEYQRVRPQLTTLGIAHERPTVTRRLFDRISRAVAQKAATVNPVDGVAP